jgi:hypothetical protein
LFDPEAMVPVLDAEVELELEAEVEEEGFSAVVVVSLSSPESM